jgi:limonene-1,2-epoxide hydrolase
MTGDAAKDTTAKNTVLQFLALCAARDLDRALQLIDPDIEYDNQPIGAVTGTSEVRRILSTGLMAEADEVDWQVLRCAAEGDLVMSERVDRFRLGDRWLDIPVAGVFELRGGRIQLWRDYFDLAGYRRQREQPR